MTKKLMTMVVAFAVSFGVRAETETVGGYTWTYRINGDRAEIYGTDNGYPSYDYTPAISPSPTGAVTIPSTLGGKPVTSIGDYAFSGCSGLTRVTIPDSVTSIGGWAFSGCSGLTRVTIPSSVTSIGLCAFADCSGLASVTIPDSVTSIGDGAFYWCRESLYDTTTIPGVELVDGWAVGYTGSLSGDLDLTGIRGIGGSAFRGCSGLTSVTIPDGVTSIGFEAFYNCSGLTSVTIPDSVTSIGSGAFEGCSGLTGVTIPDSVTSIGASAFYNCSGLTSVTIPDSVTSIGNWAFRDCSGLMSISVGSGNANYKSVNGLLLSKDGKTLMQGVNGDVTIPGSVTSIGYSAFYGCSGLTSVTIPDSVTSIGDYAFSYCSGLTSVTIPDSVTSIGASAFSGCSGLTSVTIPDSVTSIGDYAFRGCSGLMAISVGVRNSNYKSVNGLLLSKDGKTLIAGVNGDVTIPDSVTSIGDSAFYNCSGLTGVTIPDGVTSIGGAAFYGCSGLASVYLPESFNGSTGVFPSSASILRYKPVQNVILDANGGTVSPASTTVAYGSTYGELPVPYRVAYLFLGWMLGGECVSSNTTVSTLDDHRLVAQWEFKPDTWFYDVADGKATVTGYTEPVGDLSVPSEIDGYPVTAIGNGAFSNNVELTSIVIPDGVTKIEMHAFRECSGLTNVVISPSVSIIGGGAFRGCGSLSEIIFEGNAPTVSDGAFSGVDAGCRGIISRTATGWGAPVSREWNGILIAYPWYTVEFDPNGGSCAESSRTVNHGAPVGELPVPARENAVFLGWFTDADGGEKVDESLPVTQVMTLYAHWLTEVANPVISADGKTVFRTDSCAVTITCETEGATIYYTDDGSTPKKKSDYLYTEPVVITDTTTFKAVATIEGLQSEYVTVTVTKKRLTVEEASDAGDGVLFDAGDDCPWLPILDPGAVVGDATVRSGAIGNRASTWLSATVSGAGVLTFWNRVSCEHDEDNTFTWDRLMVCTNDVEIVDWRMDGEMGWTLRTLSFGGGTNTVKWIYFKDKSDAEGEDCAWIDGVEWVPDAPAGEAVDAGGGKSVTVPQSWLSENTAREATDSAANGRKVWECYVLGLDPEGVEDFRITAFPMKADGTPDLGKMSVYPPQSRWNVSGAVPKVKGAPDLAGPWAEVPEGGDPSLRFFKVEIELP